MLSLERIKKYSDLICHYVIYYRREYGLNKKILVSLDKGTEQLGKEIANGLSSLDIDFEYTKPDDKLSLLNSKTSKEQDDFLETSSKLISDYDTYIKIVTSNGMLHDDRLSTEFKNKIAANNRTILNKLEKLEENKKYLFLRSYLFTELSEIFYKQSIDVLDQTLSDALFLDFENPLKEIERRRKIVLETLRKLNKLEIKELLISSPKGKLKIGIDPKSVWLKSNLRNFPSYEIFISPSYLSTEGSYLFNIPTFYKKNKIENTFLKFTKGMVTDFDSQEHKSSLSEIVSIIGGNYVGEIGITDKRFSPINKVSGCLMFDENISGDYGNFHIALGNSYSRSFSNKNEKNNGNKSNIHVDFINTNEFTINAVLSSGKNIVLFKNGQFEL